MRIILTSDMFVFESARALLVRSDTELAFQKRCRKNVIEDIDIAAVGLYDLWLSDIELRVLSSDNRFRLNGLLFPWILKITNQDLDRRETTFAMPLGGVFRITAMDGARVPVPNHKLIASAGSTTLEILTNANGFHITYDNPTRCCFLIDAGLGILMSI